MEKRSFVSILRFFYFNTGDQFKDRGGNRCYHKKPTTFDKRNYKFSHTRICPKWDSNLLYTHYLQFLAHGNVVYREKF